MIQRKKVLREYLELELHVEKDNKFRGGEDSVSSSHRSMISFSLGRSTYNGQGAKGKHAFINIECHKFYKRRLYVYTK